MTQHVTYLNVKALGSGDDRIVEGWASTPREDRVGDVVVPEGARYELPLPLLFAHKHDEPIGSVISATVTRAGVRIRAKLTKGVARAEEVWKLIQDGALTAVSVGFQPIRSTPLPNGGLRFDEWSWHELSIVSVPANPDAKIAIGKGAAYTREPRQIRVPAATETVAKPKKSILGDAAEFANRISRDRFGDAGVQAAYEAAVKCLPEELQPMADLSRAIWDQKACRMTLLDNIGRTIATVEDDGTVRRPGEEPAGKKADAGLTSLQLRQVKQLLTELAGDVGKGVGIVTRGLLQPIREKIELLESTALSDGGFYQEGKDYRKGAIVVRDGRTWLATEDTDATPERGATGWRLLANKTTGSHQ